MTGAGQPASDLTYPRRTHCHKSKFNQKPPNRDSSGERGWIVAVLEASFYSHRPLWSLIMSGVFDRFPTLKFVVAEAGDAAAEWAAASGRTNPVGARR
jgi:hypothetical protein